VVEKGGTKAIKYRRKISFIELNSNNKPLGIEFEYNDVKGEKQEFTLDLRIKKIFYGRKIFNPSIFFGVGTPHKHLSFNYLLLYLGCVLFVLEKEFRVSIPRNFDIAFQNISSWRRLYYDYNLSKESFIADIEEPMRLSEEEKSTNEQRKSMKDSIASSISGVWK